MLTIKRPKPYKQLGLAAFAVLIGFGGMYSVLAMSGYGNPSDSGVVLSAADEQSAEAGASSKDSNRDKQESKIAKADSTRVSSTSTAVPMADESVATTSNSGYAASSGLSPAQAEPAQAASPEEASSSPKPIPSQTQQSSPDAEPGRGGGETEPGCGVVGCILQPLLQIPSITIGNL